MRQIILFAILLVSACADDPPCDTTKQTCDAAYDSARAACQERRICSTLECPDGPNGECTVDEAMDACIERAVVDLCSAIDCDSVYTRRAELDVCISAQSSNGCDPSMTDACPL